MGKLHRVMCLVVLSACSSAARVEPAGRERPNRQRAKAAVIAPGPDVRLDELGNLKRGDERISWLELPAGFVRVPGTTAQLAVYEASGVPLAKARAYLMARLSPDKVEYRKNGMVFRRSLPTHTELDLPPVEVTLLELEARPRSGEPAANAGQHTLQLLVEDLTPPPTRPLSEEAAALELARAQKRIE
jgi:hypothetical protein